VFAGRNWDFLRNTAFACLGFVQKTYASQGRFLSKVRLHSAVMVRLWPEKK
jgi:hypothetical protein